jgi:hypothetical protein
MSIKLPTALECYFATENAHRAWAVEECFASNATVRDEGKTIQGSAAIKAWRVETGEKYQHSVEPLSVVTRDGKVVVTARVSGKFPGSPIILDHIFEMQGDKITSLEIR